MKRKLFVGLLVFALLLALPGCGRKEQEPEGGIQLYFLKDSGESAGSFVPGAALGTQSFDAAACTQSHREGNCPNPGCLLAALLAGPESAGLRTPFPRNTSMKSWSWDEEEPGHLRVVMSEHYSGLTDIALTLADYCIVLTLSQLDSVETVEIQTLGYSANYRSHQVMAAAEALLDSGLADLAQSAS